MILSVRIRCISVSDGCCAPSALFNDLETFFVVVVVVSMILLTPVKCHMNDAMRRFYLRLCVTHAGCVFFLSYLSLWKDDKHSSNAVSQLLQYFSLYFFLRWSLFVKIFVCRMVACCRQTKCLMGLRTFLKLPNRLHTHWIKRNILTFVVRCFTITPCHSLD